MIYVSDKKLPGEEAEVGKKGTECIKSLILKWQAWGALPFFFCFSSHAGLTEQPIRVLSLTDRLCRQFHILSRPKSCRQGPTSISGAGHTVTLGPQMLMVALTEAGGRLVAWCVTALKLQSFVALFGIPVFLIALSQWVFGVELHRVHGKWVYPNGKDMRFSRIIVVEVEGIKVASVNWSVPLPHLAQSLPACIWLALLKSIGRLSNQHNK